MSPDSDAGEERGWSPGFWECLHALAPFGNIEAPERGSSSTCRYAVLYEGGRSIKEHDEEKPD